MRDLRKIGLLALLLFLIGGSGYVLLELLWRQYSHWTMFLAGGLCFLLITAENESLPAKTALWQRSLLGGLTITAVEFLSGLILNRWLGWDIWDYSAYRFQLMGQISLQYSLGWAALSVFLSRFGHILYTGLKKRCFPDEPAE